MLEKLMNLKNIAEHFYKFSLQKLAQIYKNRCHPQGSILHITS